VSLDSVSILWTASPLMVRGNPYFTSGESRAYLVEIIAKLYVIWKGGEMRQWLLEVCDG